MKADALTFAAIVFVIGVLMSSISLSDIFGSSEGEDLPNRLGSGIQSIEEGDASVSAHPALL